MSKEQKSDQIEENSLRPPISLQYSVKIQHPKARFQPAPLTNISMEATAYTIKCFQHNNQAVYLIRIQEREPVNILTVSEPADTDRITLLGNKISDLIKQYGIIIPCTTGTPMQITGSEEIIGSQSCRHLEQVEIEKKQKQAILLV